MRIQLLDILRGAAIVGTLGTNIWIFAHLGDVNAIFTFQDNSWWSSFDTFLRVWFLALINGKFLGLLAILFGIGMELKYAQSLRKGRPWPGVYLWTASILLVEGFLHYTLVYEYDILMSYAIVGMIVSFVMKAGEKAIKKILIWIGGFHGLIILLIFLAVLASHLAGQPFSLGNMKQEIALYHSGTWWEQIQFRLTNFLILRSEAIFAIPLNVILFLTGVLLMKKGAFASDEKGRIIRRKMLKIGVCAGLPLNLLFLVPGGLFDFPVRYLFAPILAIGYMGVMAAAVEKRIFSRLWEWLEKVGKMSLSNYVLQNVVCSILFYGWGFGLGGRMNALSVIVLWIAINIVQIIFSVIWLRLFALGPLETARKVVSGLYSSR